MSILRFLGKGFGNFVKDSQPERSSSSSASGKDGSSVNGQYLSLRIFRLSKRDRESGKDFKFLHFVRLSFLSPSGKSSGKISKFLQLSRSSSVILSVNINGNFLHL